MRAQLNDIECGKRGLSAKRGESEPKGAFHVRALDLAMALSMLIIIA